MAGKVGWEPGSNSNTGREREVAYLSCPEKAVFNLQFIGRQSPEQSELTEARADVTDGWQEKWSFQKEQNFTLNLNLFHKETHKIPI